MVNDTISDLLTRIRNANLIKSQTVSIPLTRISKQITEILEKQGFIESFQIFSFPSSQFNDFQSTLGMSNESSYFENSQEKSTVTQAETSSSAYKKKQSFFKNKNNLTNKKINTQSKINALSQEIILYLKYKGPKKKPCITNLKRISKPGLRIYTTHKDIPKILGGMGIAILSTSKGIMTDREARFHKIGGEILCSIW